MKKLSAERRSAYFEPLEPWIESGVFDKLLWGEVKDVARRLARSRDTFVDTRGGRSYYNTLIR